MEYCTHMECKFGECWRLASHSPRKNPYRWTVVYESKEHTKELKEFVQWCQLKTLSPASYHDSKVDERKREFVFKFTDKNEMEKMFQEFLRKYGTDKKNH